jgi:hypothetical protein
MVQVLVGWVVNFNVLKQMSYNYSLWITITSSVLWKHKWSKNVQFYGFAKYSERFGDEIRKRSPLFDLCTLSDFGDELGSESKSGTCSK